MLKNNKGITLIALVITIIVLLILAGVSIAMLTGDNGILNQATRATDENNRAEVLERVNMELNGQLANAMAHSPFNTKTEIDSNLGLAEGKINGYTVTVAVTDSTTAGAGNYGTDAKVKITVGAGSTGDTGTFSEGIVTHDGTKWTVSDVEYTPPTTE